ncbi:energy transducer TonB [Dokdonella fugitiva]|uniref:energy transducer TonB n=1 Tax=Dokdonella fugitiva TaxID=328517 RepID=UPI0015F8AEA7|nr:energy transducer TonB [Dokdonella fugitiva]MBA8884935.1 hypothetical protein [Dokdonella fugitiva]
MRRSIPILLLALLGGQACAEETGKPLHLTRSWRLSLDAAGRVASLDGDRELDPAIRVPLEQAIRRWEFEPGRVAGEPAPTETTLTLDVTFHAAPDGNYVAHVDDARVGGTIDFKPGKMAPPRIPRDAVRIGLVARVVVKAEYDGDGRIVSVEPQREEGINSLPSLERATVNAVKHWSVVPERVGGHGVASSIMVPICFTVTQGLHAPDFDCTWTPPGSHARVANGGAFALAPATKLRSDVIGHAL